MFCKLANAFYSRSPGHCVASVRLDTTWKTVRATERPFPQVRLFFPHVIDDHAIIPDGKPYAKERDKVHTTYVKTLYSVHWPVHVSLL